MACVPRVVVADDEAHCRMLIKGALRGLGYEVVAEAANGRDAVAKALETRADLVCLDFNMPIMTGLEALRLISREAPETAVIMLTSVAEVASVNACIEEGAIGYVRKDTPIPELRRIIREAWEGFCDEGEPDA